MKLNVGFLASHGGSNFQAIVDAIKSGKLSAVASCVISNNSKAFVRERAEKENIPFYHISGKTHPNPEDHDKAIIDAFKHHDVNIVCLAGYMKKLSDTVLNEFHGRVLNIHPALLPKFGGKGMYGINVHKAVIESGEKTSGVTVHLVDSKYDRGRILAQTKVPVEKDDTPEDLADRVLTAEHQIYWQTLVKIEKGEIQL